MKSSTNVWINEGLQSFQRKKTNDKKKPLVSNNMSDFSSIFKSNSKNSGKVPKNKNMNQS